MTADETVKLACVADRERLVVDGVGSKVAEPLAIAALGEQRRLQKLQRVLDV